MSSRHSRLHCLEADKLCYTTIMMACAIARTKDDLSHDSLPPPYTELAVPFDLLYLLSTVGHSATSGHLGVKAGSICEGQVTKAFACDRSLVLTDQHQLQNAWPCC